MASSEISSSDTQIIFPEGLVIPQQWRRESIEEQLPVDGRTVLVPPGQGVQFTIVGGYEGGRDITISVHGSHPESGTRRSVGYTVENGGPNGAVARRVGSPSEDLPIDLSQVTPGLPGIIVAAIKS